MLRHARKLTEMPLWLHVGATAVAFGVFQAVRITLDASCAASNHPVDYATGQTTFDADRIKGFYAVMEQAGTLDIYVRTQVIDMGFLTMIGVFGLLLGTLVARLGAPGSWARGAGLGAAVAAVFGALCDASENAVSFVMLADPQGFADWLALPYSGFAVVKFALITLAMALVLAALGLGLAGRITTRLSKG